MDELKDLVVVVTGSGKDSERALPSVVMAREPRS